MAYPNYTMPYQSIYSPYSIQPQYPQATPAQPQQQSNGIIWVQGEAGAKSYLVAPNTTVQLWDSEKQTIYLKSADASGMPSLKVLDYTVRDTAPAHGPVAAQTGQQPAQDYATKADLEMLAGQIHTLRAELDSMTAKEAKRDE